MEKTWEALGLPPSLIEGLKKQKIVRPASVQSCLLPVFLSGKDIVVQSETGSGKTLGYLLPLFMKLDSTKRATQALILLPTHELAAQVNRQIRLLAENSGMEIKSALIIGSAGIDRQIERLKEKPQIVVGSAGRILHLISRKKMQAHSIQTIVVDEADRMTDKLNLTSVQAVVKTTQRVQRQLIFVSASITKETRMAANAMMKEPVYLLPEAGPKVPVEITHGVIHCEKRDKVILVRKIIRGIKPRKTIVFLNNPESIRITVEKLCYHQLMAVGIYGGADKQDRKNALDAFSAGRVEVLVASDISARGLDIPDVDLVINLDIPEDAVQYQHRAGRCGRQKKKGLVLSLATAYEAQFLRNWEKQLEITIIPKEMINGRLCSPVKKRDFLYEKEKETTKRGRPLKQSVEKPAKKKKNCKK